MSLRLSHLAALASALFLVASLSACSPKATTGEGANFDSEGGSSEGGSRQEAPKVDKDEVKDAEKEAKALNEENHELRREVFQLKTKLGLPVDTEK